MPDTVSEDQDLKARVKSLEDTLKMARIVALTAAALLAGVTGITFYQLPSMVVAKLTEKGALKAEADLEEQLNQVRKKLDSVLKEEAAVARSQVLDFDLPGGGSETKPVEFDFPVKMVWTQLLGKGGSS